MDEQEGFSDVYTSLHISLSQEYSNLPVPDAARSPYPLAARWHQASVGGFFEAAPFLSVDLRKNWNSSQEKS